MTTGAMAFGDAAGTQVLHSFQVLFRDEQGVEIGNFGPSRQPFPSYAVGHQLDVRGEFRTISAVQHTVLPKADPDDWVLQTTVIVR